MSMSMGEFLALRESKDSAFPLYPWHFDENEAIKTLSRSARKKPKEVVRTCYEHLMQQSEDDALAYLSQLGSVAPRIKWVVKAVASSVTPLKHVPHEAAVLGVELSPYTLRSYRYKTVSARGELTDFWEAVHASEFSPGDRVIEVPDDAYAVMEDDARACLEECGKVLSRLNDCRYVDLSGALTDLKL